MRKIWFVVCFAAATILENLEQRILGLFIRYRGVSK